MHTSDGSTAQLGQANTSTTDEGPVCSHALHLSALCAAAAATLAASLSPIVPSITVR
jgi:hypothetical protein